MLLKGLEVLFKLKPLYEDSSALTKSEILDLIYRGKQRFAGSEYQTPRINEAAQLIYQTTSGLGGNKNGKDRSSERLSRRVLPTLQLYKHFFGDLEVLLQLIA